MKVLALLVVIGLIGLGWFVYFAAFIPTGNAVT
jgi:hypothetical protein